MAGPAAAAGAQAPVALGRVLGPWGLRGWIRIEPYGGARDSALLTARRWHLARPAAPAAPPIDRWIDVERARTHGATVVAKPAGSDDREAALALKGAQIAVPRADFPALADDAYYWIDLIGCAVRNPDGEPLGTVVSVDDHGAHAILATDAGVMIPFVDAYVLEVDPAARRIVADWQHDWSR
jgi:16S rRNA processing protein RimM